MSKRTKKRAAWGALTQVDAITWRIRYWSSGPDGYKRRSKTIRGTRKDAERVRAELMLAHSEDAPCPTVGEVWRAFCEPDLQRMADDLGVRVLSVKRWESPRYPQHAPAEAWELLDMLMARQDSAVAAALAQVRDVASDMGGEPAEVRLPYWASQDDYMEHHYLAAESDASWTEVNAANRRVAVMLRWLGFRVRWVDGSDNPVPRA